MEFRETVILYIILYHLERNYTHEYITVMIIETNKQEVVSDHSELSITL